MDRLKIRYVINSNNFDLSFGDYSGAALINLDLYKSTGGRIMSYFAYNPHQHKKCIEVIMKYYDNKIFKGVKIHPSWHKTSADDDLYHDIWSYCEKRGIIMIAHTWDMSLTNPVQELSFPSRFEKYVKKYPGVTLICAHSGGRYNGIVAAVKLAFDYDNVYLDIAGDIYANGFIEYATGRIGSERILYGSDYGMMDQRNTIGMVLGADIRLKDKENILYRNATKLFGIG
jgi:predicted TIM-barrel fold metal-dependent hydrolase